MDKEIKIIIAEDHEYYRTLLVEELKEFNIKTIGVASTGFELLDIVRLKTFDVLILDLRMPGMEGNEAFDIIIKEFPEAKIIIMSMYGEMCLMEDFMNRGAFGFLPKLHSSIEILNEMIREVHVSNKCFYFFDPKLKQFNRREQEIIPLLIDGKTSKEISSDLNVSMKAVEGARTNIYKKTKSRNLSVFSNYATKKGLDFLKRIKRNKRKKRK